MQSGNDTQDLHQQCLSWRQEHPDHELAWQQLQNISSRFQSLPNYIAHATLDDGNRARQWERRTLLKSLAIALGTGTLGYSGYRYMPWQNILADETTATGQQRRLALADGTILNINTSSAADIRYDASIRLIRLWHGEIMVTTGHAAGDNRPFVVETAAGRIRALGTRFLVRQHAHSTLIHLYEGDTEIQIMNAASSMRLHAGQQLEFSAAALGQAGNADPDASAWIEGSIVAKDMRLVNFVQELDRYHTGKIRCDDAAANVRISGVYPINDLAYVLETLVQHFDIKVTRFSRYWTKLSLSRSA